MAANPSFVCIPPIRTRLGSWRSGIAVPSAKNSGFDKTCGREKYYFIKIFEIKKYTVRIQIQSHRTLKKKCVLHSVRQPNASTEAILISSFQHCIRKPHVAMPVLTNPSTSIQHNLIVTYEIRLRFSIDIRYNPPWNILTSICSTMGIYEATHCIISPGCCGDGIKQMSSCNILLSSSNGTATLSGRFGFQAILGYRVLTLFKGDEITATTTSSRVSKTCVNKSIPRSKYLYTNLELHPFVVRP